MNIKKYFDLTFEQSEKITENQRLCLINEIEKSSSLLSKCIANGFSLLFICLVIAGICALPVMMQSIFPKNYISFSRCVSIFVLFQIIVFTILFFIFVRINNYIYKSIYINLFFLAMTLPIIQINTASIIFCLRRKLNKTTYIVLMIFYFILLVISFLVIYKQYLKLNNDYRKNKMNPDKNVKSYYLVEKVDKYVKKFNIYATPILFFLVVIRLVRRLFLKEGSFGRSFKFMGLFLFWTPILIFLILYMFYYEIAGFIFPTYYLLKYQKEYEEKYQISFSGKKRNHQNI